MQSVGSTWACMEHWKILQSPVALAELGRVVSYLGRHEPLALPRTGPTTQLEHPLTLPSPFPLSFFLPSFISLFLRLFQMFISYRLTPSLLVSECVSA